MHDTIDENICSVQGIIDSDKNKQNKKWKNKFLIESPEKLLNAEFDCILISVKRYEPILQKCLNMGIESDKIIVFWKPDKSTPYIDRTKAISSLERILEKYTWRLENLPYELGIKETPQIQSSIVLLNKVIENKLSVCRFGDGEFEIMRGRERPWFQNVNEKLSIRLMDVFNSREAKNIVIAIANNFGNLDCYTEEASDEIRKYMCAGTRKEIMKWIDMEYIYYDAYVSRPYIIYKDKKQSGIIFELYKKLWKNRQVLIVEGNYTRMGMGNDLFANASKIRRIQCPQKNAFDMYEKILNSVRDHVYGDELVLISLGPTATVLAYDLAQAGIQAFDIGQLDNEYEWFLSKVDKRSEILGKSVSELEGCFFPKENFTNTEYENQVIDKIFS